MSAHFIDTASFSTDHIFWVFPVAAALIAWLRTSKIIRLRNVDIDLWSTLPFLAPLRSTVDLLIIDYREILRPNDLIIDSLAAWLLFMTLIIMHWNLPNLHRNRAFFYITLICLMQTWDRFANASIRYQPYPLCGWTIRAQGSIKGPPSWEPDIKV